MAASYLRYFTFDPGSTVLLSIESVNILDLSPPGSVQGVGTSLAMLTGEFEDGPFNVPTQLASAQDLPNVFGTLGYTVNGTQCKYPSAQTRYADAQIPPEYWNGNGFLALNGKQFGGLVVNRVNTSTGAVSFTFLADITGAAAFAYPMVTGQTLGLKVDATTTVVTFTGVAATVTGSAITSPTLFTGVESLVLSYDGHPNFTVYFQAADQLIADVVARINQYAGFAFAAVATADIKLTGRVAGLAGSVVVVSGSTGVLTTLGLSAATTAGTGSTQNIAAVKFSELKTLIEAAVTGTLVQQDQSGNLRISNTATPGTGTLEVTAATATSLGFVVGQKGDAAALAAAAVGQSIPAGTVVSDAPGTNVFVTMQTTPITAAAGAGPYTIPVRYAVDTTGAGSGVGVAPGVAVKLVTPPTVGSFSVINLLPIAAQMTDAQVDAAYVTALGFTTNINGVAKKVVLSWAARHSNAVRSALRANAILAPTVGCYGRVACVSPPLNTAGAVALSTVAAPGVGATRSDRVIYCYVGANVFVPLIGQVGTAGGAGFTASGNIDQTSDGWMVSICSQLPPEENPGQDTTFTSVVNSIETGANVQNFQIGDYQLFKAAGISALRFDTDNGVAIFQSGVTSVDPLVNPGLVRISRRRMADFLEWSIAIFASGFGKRLSTLQRRVALASEITAFLDGLLGRNQPGTQRIDGYTVDPKSGNTPDLLRQGLYWIIVKVRTLVSLDSIVLAFTIGDSVVTSVELPAAA